MHSQKWVIGKGRRLLGYPRVAIVAMTRGVIGARYWRLWKRSRPTRWTADGSGTSVTSETCGEDSSIARTEATVIARSLSWRCYRIDVPERRISVPRPCAILPSTARWSRQAVQQPRLVDKQGRASHLRVRALYAQAHRKAGGARAGSAHFGATSTVRSQAMETRHRRCGASLAMGQGNVGASETGRGPALATNPPRPSTRNQRLLSDVLPLSPGLLIQPLSHSPLLQPIVERRRKLPYTTFIEERLMGNSISALIEVQEVKVTVVSQGMRGMSNPPPLVASTTLFLIMSGMVITTHF